MSVISTMIEIELWMFGGSNQQTSAVLFSRMVANCDFQGRWRSGGGKHGRSCVTFGRPLKVFRIQQCEILNCLSHRELRAHFQPIQNLDHVLNRSTLEYHLQFISYESMTSDFTVLAYSCAWSWVAVVTELPWITRQELQGSAKTRALPVFIQR